MIDHMFTGETSTELMGMPLDIPLILFNITDLCNLSVKRPNKENRLYVVVQTARNGTNRFDIFSFAAVCLRTALTTTSQCFFRDQNAKLIHSGGFVSITANGSEFKMQD